jgi:catechol 2,3-dioxygenase-like lactoylglutathione lyase family enzyme
VGKKVIKEVRHTGIVITDMEKSLAFYRDLLGLKIANDSIEEGDYIDSVLGLSDIRVHIVKMTAPDGSMVELLQYHSHPRKAPSSRQLCDIGCSHVAFTVDDIDKEYNRLLKSGVKFVTPPRVSPDGYAKVTFCLDPEGNFVELAEVLE